MKFEIKNRWTESVMFSLEIDSFKLCVDAAVRQKTNLARADLAGANLAGANLAGADLAGAKNFNKLLSTPLYMLLDQPGKIRAYKIVNSKNEGIFRGGVKYIIGKSVLEKSADCDEATQCGRGINLATLDWCMKEWCKGRKILICEFEAKDIAAIPIATDGKFRVHRCEVVGKKDLKEIGLIKRRPTRSNGPAWYAAMRSRLTGGSCEKMTPRST